MTHILRYVGVIQLGVGDWLGGHRLFLHMYLTPFNLYVI